MTKSKCPLSKTNIIFSLFLVSILISRRNGIINTNTINSRNDFKNQSLYSKLVQLNRIYFSINFLTRCNEYGPRNHTISMKY